MILWQLFSSFFRIGCFTIGGGYAMLPLMQKEVVDNKHWLTETDFVDRMQGMGVSIYGAAFYDKNWKQLFSIEIEKLKQVFINTH